MTPNTEIDYVWLDRELDRVKTKIFTSNNGGFLGPLMCSLNFLWVRDIETAATNGRVIIWNPDFFMKMKREVRVTILLHEIWHVALLHMLRRGDRRPDYWNWACDIYINDMLIRDGHTFDGFHPWASDHLNRWKHPMQPPLGNFSSDDTVEDIYDQLLAIMPPHQFDLASIFSGWGEDNLAEDTDIPGANPFTSGDLIEPEEGDTSMEHEIVGNVVVAGHASKMASGPGMGIPSDVEEILQRFLQPKLPWATIVQQWLTELANEDYSMQRPDRRYKDMYLPSTQEEEGGLVHLMCFFDQSGSVSEAEIVRYNSEMKHIKDYYNPKMMTLIMFDDCIQKVIELSEFDPYEEIVIIGRGGTDFRPVREHIIEHKPTAVLVFSDMATSPMEKLPDGMDIPILWVAINANPNTVVNTGRIIFTED